MKKIFLVLTMLLSLSSTLWIEKVSADNVVFYSIRNENDWLKFRDEVAKSKGQYWVDARLEADITTGGGIGLDSDTPYRGTFDGNGHTLTVDIYRNDGKACALFCYVGDVTIKDLHVKGKITGGIHSAGLIGQCIGGSRTITINRVWVSTDVNASSTTHAGGIIGHSSDATLVMNDCRFDGSITTNNQNSSSYIGCIVGWCDGGGWTFHRVYNCCNSVTAWRIWFCGDHNSNTDAVGPWGSNSKSSLTITNTVWSDWGTTYYNKKDQNEVMKLMNAEQPGSWTLVDGKAVPVMNQNSVTGEWTYLSSGSSSGYSLPSGHYYVTQNITFSNGATGSGLTIANGATVYLYVPQGVTLTARGGNANGQTGAGAGIQLPKGSKLFLLGRGKVVAYGGNGASGSNGNRGGNASFSRDNWLKTGSGGRGGNGGGGAGAGIGTRGGNGGEGGSGGSEVYYSDWKSHGGNAGSKGVDGGTALEMGDLYVDYTSGIQVEPHGGNRGDRAGNGGGKGDCTMDDEGTFSYDYSVGGGGGGGCGGFGGSAYNIGTGGCGGGGGGGGASGTTTWSSGHAFFKAGAKGGNPGTNGDGPHFWNTESGYGEASELTSYGDYNNRGWADGENPAPGGESGDRGYASKEKPLKYPYVIRYNAKNMTTGAVNMPIAGYNSNVSSGTVTVTIPTNYQLGLVKQDQYVEKWYINSNYTGDWKAAYDEYSIGPGTTDLYAQWKDYKNLFSKGDGSKYQPFIIEQAGLLALADYVNNGGNTHNVYFKQEGDILIQDILASTGRSKWSPIGHSRIFEGDYDGGGYLIRKGTIADDGVAQGIFGLVTGSIHNLGVENVSLSTSKTDVRCGAIAGTLFGYGDERTITRQKASMHDCYAANNTINAPYAGGLVGEMTQAASMTHCHGYKNKLSGSNTGHIASQILNQAKVDYSFTTGGNISANGDKNTTNCESGIDDNRMANGLMTWTLNDKTAYDVTWFQDLKGQTYPDAYPVLDKESNHVYLDNGTYTNQTTGIYSLTGEGTAEKPFLVTSVDDMKKIAKYCNGGSKSTGIHFLQTTDIDFSNVNDWDAIGHGGTFDGYYDGGGHSIRNGNIKPSSSSEGIVVGIFGVVTGTVNRLSVENTTFEVNYSDHARVGGIAARLSKKGEIKNCLVKGCKVITNRIGIAGGIVADMFDQAAVRNCLVVETTIKASRTGQICSDTKANTLIERCFTDGADMVSNDHKGSISKSKTSMKYANLASGEVAYWLNNENNTPDPIWFQNLEHGERNDSTPVLSSEHAMVFKMNGEYTNDYYDISRLGKGTKDNPYRISNVEQLQQLIVSIGIMKNSNFYVLQTADIIMDDTTTIVPIGTCTNGFEGHYDGGGHVIKGMTMQNYQGESMGLFNNISGVVEHLGIENSKFIAEEKITRVGAFAGKLTGNGVLRDCYVKGSTIDSDSTSGVVVGALVGEQTDASRIESCYGYKNTVNGQNDGRKHYGYITGYIGKNASADLVFTDGPQLCADKQSGEENMLRSNAGVDELRFQTGELCYLLSGSRNDNTPWRQTIKKDSVPFFGTTHKQVYRHPLAKQVLYTNSSDEPESVMLYLNPNYPKGNVNAVNAFVVDNNYFVPDFKFEPYALSRDYYYFAGWNTQADGKGTFYPAKGSFLPTKNTIFYAVWQMKVPADGETNVVELEKFGQDTIFFKIYDNGGANTPYGYNYNGKLNLKAPADHVILLTGTISTEALGSDGEPHDYMAVYDGDESSDLMTNAQAKSGENFDAYFFSTTDGAKEDIGKLMSTGEETTIEFVSDEEHNYYGLDLMATVLPSSIRSLGQGTKEDPFVVECYDDLKTVDEYIQLTGDSKIYIKQNDDIDLADEEFEPLASSVESFEGQYDGCGYVIKNMEMDVEEGKALGLFHNVSGIVERLGIVNSTLKGAADNVRIGAIAGRLSGDGQVRHCYAQYNNYSYSGDAGVVGALVGEQTDASRIESCYAYGNVFAENDESDGQQHMVAAVGEKGATATQTLLFSSDEVSKYRFCSGDICYQLNSVLRDSIIWRQTIGTDSLPTFSSESDIVYSYGQGSTGFTNEDFPEVLNFRLVDIVTDEVVVPTVYKGSMVNMDEVQPAHRYFLFKGWNDEAKGDGAFYPRDTMFVYNDEMTLYTQWDMVINMANDDTERITQRIPKDVPFAKVYDNGGRDTTYTAGHRYVTLTAPEGYVLQVKGTVASKTAGAADREPADYLAVYDGNSAATLKDNLKLANDSAKNAEGWKHIYYSTAAGEPYDIGVLSSSGSEMTIVFHTAAQDNTEYPGIDLTVKAVPVDSAVCALGQGTEEEPYKVTTTADLKNLTAYSSLAGTNFYAQQIDDIDMEGLTIEPLFGDSATFAGHYDGGGHVIRNLKMENYKGITLGLFASVSGTVERLGIENSTFKAVANDARVGALAARLADDALLSDCYVKGCTIAYNDVRGVVGALVGELSGNSCIQYCYGFQNEVSGYKEKSGRKRYGYIAGDMAGTATQTMVFTDGPTFCSDGQGESGNITDAYGEVPAEQFTSGEVCYQLNDSQSNDVIWYQTLATDSMPVLSDSHGVVYRHEAGDEVVYTNSATADYVKLHLIDLADSLGNKDVDILVGAKVMLANYMMEHRFFVFKDWNTEADGSGTTYLANDTVKMFEDLTLYSQWDLKITMPEDETERVSMTIPQGLFAQVFDDGGPDGTYSAGTRYVTLTAPEGSVLQLKGIVATRTAEADSEPQDYLAVYDNAYSTLLTDQDKLSNSKAKSGNGWQNLYYSNAPGEPTDIGVLTSSGREMTILFHSVTPDNSYYQGLNLEVTVVPVSAVLAGMEGKGTLNEPYLVATRADLKNLAAYVNQTGEAGFCVKQTADIDMTGVPMKPIGTEEHPFCGSYDGDSHTITLDINSEKEGENALFGTIDNDARILNLNIAGTINTTAKYAGSLVSRVVNGTIRYCYSTATINAYVDGEAAVGGLVGTVNGYAIITDCAFAGSINKGYADTKGIGGLVGKNAENASILFQNCYVAGTHTATFDDAISGGSTEGVEVTNTFYLNTITNHNSNGATAVSASDFAWGKVCYQLNDGHKTWRQTLGTDQLPVLDDSHEIVYCHVNSETSQTKYANSQDEPEEIKITLHYNDGSDRTREIMAFRQTSEDESGLEFDLNLPDNISFKNCMSSKVVGWTEFADGRGVDYLNNPRIKPYQDMDLYAQWDGLVICIPKDRTLSIDIPQSVTTIKVRNEVGPYGEYSEKANGELRLNVPKQSKMQISGTVVTEGLHSWYGKHDPYDYLLIYDERMYALRTAQARSYSGKVYDGCYCSAENGEELSIDELETPANVAVFRFISDGSKQYSGVNLNVKVVKAEYDIRSKEDFIAINGKTGDFYLKEDIDLDEWNGYFILNGNLDGGGHTITYSGSANCQGLFKEVTSAASVKHLRVEANVVTTVDCAGIAYNNEGLISDCHFHGNIQKLRDGGTNCIAGIALNVFDDGKIDHCSATGSLELTDTRSGGVYPISKQKDNVSDHWTWISPTNTAGYAAKIDSAQQVQADYPVYAQGIMDAASPRIFLGNEIIPVENKHLESLTITDGERFNCTAEVTIDQITYKRRGTDNAYEPWILPFDYTIDASMFREGVEFYRFEKDSEGNIQMEEITPEETYLVAANEPLAFLSGNDSEIAFQMKLVKNGQSQPMTIRMPVDGTSATLASQKDIARLNVAYDNIAPDRTVKEMMYIWSDADGDFILGDSTSGLQPFRYYLQYIDKTTGNFERYEETSWGIKEASGANASRQSLAKRRAVQRAPFSTLTAQGWQPIFLDPRESQVVTAKMLEDYEILYLSDIYDEKATDTDDDRYAVTVIYETAVEGTELYLAAPLLVRAKHADAEPLVTEQAGQEITELVMQAEEKGYATELDELHYWCATFAGRYDVWQLALPEKDSLLNEYGALVLGNSGNDSFFYRVDASDATTMQPMSYCFTAYDAKTFENLPLANDRIEIIVLDSEATGIEELNSQATNRDGRSYNLKGQKVDDSYRGIVIKNGRKRFINKRK